MQAQNFAIYKSQNIDSYLLNIPGEVLNGESCWAKCILLEE